jgi:hypothetical protein
MQPATQHQPHNTHSKGPLSGVFGAKPQSVLPGEGDRTWRGTDPVGVIDFESRLLMGPSPGSDLVSIATRPTLAEATAFLTWLAIRQPGLNYSMFDAHRNDDGASVYVFTEDAEPAPANTPFELLEVFGPDGYRFPDATVL